MSTPSEKTNTATPETEPQKTNTPGEANIVPTATIETEKQKPQNTSTPGEPNTVSTATTETEKQKPQNTSTPGEPNTVPTATAEIEKQKPQKTSTPGEPNTVPIATTETEKHKLQNTSTPGEPNIVPTATTETEKQKPQNTSTPGEPNTVSTETTETEEQKPQKTSTPGEPNTVPTATTETEEQKPQKTSTPGEPNTVPTATTETEKQKPQNTNTPDLPNTGMGTTADSTKQQHTITGCNLTFLTSDDDDAMVKQIQETHVSTDPKGKVDVKPLLRIIVDILPHATSSTPGNIQAIKAQLDALNSRLDEAINLVNEIAKLQQEHIMREISCQISCKCSGGADAHATTVAVFKTLSCYSWHAKVVIVLAVFAINYGKFWPVMQLYPNIPLAKSVAIIEQLLDNIANLTSCIIESPATATTIPTAVYWTIRSIVACASQVMGLMGMGHEYIPSIMEAWELSTLTHRVSNIESELTKQMIVSCQREANKKLEGLMNAEPLGHNGEILKAFIIVEKEEKMLLFHRSNKDGVSIDVLRNKNVLLLISDLDFSGTYLSALIQLYEKSERVRYDILWLPVIDRSTTWNDVKQKQFETLRGLMPWYSVYHPSMLVIDYVKKVFKFSKNPLIVMVDSSGKVGEAKDIQTIIWRWEEEWEEEIIWDKVTWNMKLLIGTFSAKIRTWISQKKYIFIYGGEDIEWIKRFTTTARNLARDANIELEMLYVGKSDPGEKVAKNIAIIKEQLSHTVLELSQIQLFWVRLHSIGCTGEKLSQRVDSDKVLQEIRAVVSFDRSDQCWAISSGKPGEIATAKGDTIMKSISHYNRWKDSAKEKGFVPALKEHLESVEKNVVCGECGHHLSETK